MKTCIVYERYLVNKPSTAKFRVKPMAKDLAEALLVMIIAMPAGIIDSTNIKHGLQRIKDLKFQKKERQTSKCRTEYTK
jgi:hypothetical protein